MTLFVNFKFELLCWGVLINEYEDEITLEPGKIARHYLRTWFIVDILSSIPIDYLFLIFNGFDDYERSTKTGSALKVMRLVKLISLLRFLRLIRFVRYISHWKEVGCKSSSVSNIHQTIQLDLFSSSLTKQVWVWG